MMDDEVAKELSRLRAAKASQQSEANDWRERRQQLVADFTRTMLEHRVPTYPICFESYTSTSETKKQRYSGWGSVKMKWTCTTYRYTRELVAEGWPIETPTGESNNPPGHLDPCVITTQGLVIAAYWSGFWAGTRENDTRTRIDINEPDPRMVQLPHGRHEFLSSRRELVIVDRSVTAADLAKALQHYLG